MRIISIIFLLLGITLIANAQTINIIDANSGQAIELVTLISKNPKAIATTNAEGNADISLFKGSEEIQIHMYGYKTRFLSFAALASQEFQVQLTVDIFDMDEVVVSATRWRQFASDVPSKITSISPKEVALQNPQTAADLLAISGKVYIQKSQQGGGSPMIRGFATNRLLYTVDGVRMNNAIFRGGNLQNVINLDPFTLDDIEILFGPGSVIYGSDAIGGVMSFQTLRPEFSLTDTSYIAGKANARYSSANQEKTGHFDVNIGWKKWALVTSFSAWDYNHLKQGSKGPTDYLKPYYVQRIDSVDRVIEQEDPLLQIPTAYSQINLMQKIRFKPRENWDIQYGFHFSETSAYGRYDRHNRTRNNLPRYAEWNYGPQKWMMHHISIDHQANSILFDELSIRLAQQSFEESRIDRSFNSAEKTTQIEKVKASSINLDLSKNWGNKHVLYYGSEFVSNDVESTGQLRNINNGSSQASVSRYPEANWSSLGIYINDEFRVSKMLTLQSGFRFTQYNLKANFDTTLFNLPFAEADLINNALTGSIGVVFKPNNKWVVRSNFGTAFRAPNVDDIGKIFDSEPGAVTIPNPNLRAEYAYSADFAVTKVFGSFLKMELGAYYTFLNKAIVRRNFNLNGRDSILYDSELSQVQALQNAALAKVWGIQASIELKLSTDLVFSTDLNYQTGEEELEDGSKSPARHAAPFFGVSRLTYETKNLQMQLYTQYQAERPYDELAIEERGKDEIYAKDSKGNNFAPAWYTLNLKAQFVLSNSLSIMAGLENITDQRYRAYSSGISGAGRNFILSIKANF